VLSHSQAEIRKAKLFTGELHYVCQTLNWKRHLWHTQRPLWDVRSCEQCTRIASVSCYHFSEPSECAGANGHMRRRTHAAKRQFKVTKSQSVADIVG